MIQYGFLDFDSRLHRIDKAGDPLTKINETIDWELFRPTLERAKMKDKKFNAGAKGFDVVLLFKILVLQSLYNLSDKSMEFQILISCLDNGFLFSTLYEASFVPVLPVLNIQSLIILIFINKQIRKHLQICH